MAARRQGRGRLSSIELLPDHADEAVRAALDELALRDKPQIEILADLNGALARLDPPCGPVSLSAFNRFSLRFAAQARRLHEAREAAAALAERLEDMPAGDVGLMVGETIKALINDLLLDRMMSGESPAMKDLLAAAEAVQRLENARRQSLDVAERAKKAVVASAAKAVDRAVSEGRIDAEAARRAREIMGFA